MIRPYRPPAGKAPKGTANPVFEEFDRWMKTHQPEGARPAPEASDDDDLGSAIVFFAAIAGVLVVCVFGFVFSRRERPRPPAPMGPVPGVPPGFGQQHPPGPPPAAQPMGGRPQYQPPAQPGGVRPAPPGWGPPEGGPPVQPPR